MSEAYDFGKKAEEFIAKKYIKNGYKILERNWFFRPAEIDIIAIRDNILAIVEVKARGEEPLEHAESSVNNKKKRLLIMAANEYIERHDIDVECRFDIAVVSYQNNKFTSKMFIDAFQANEI